ncbi:MAG: bacteriohemerythrin [Deferribacterales bacterium]|jgi:hemerythrin
MAVYNEQFSSGIPFMDNSTKRFISELNKLSDAMKNGEGREYVFFALDFLKDFCETHLALENKVMLQYDFYDYANHTEAHAKLREDVIALMKRCEESGADHATPLAVQRMMAGWLMRHVSKSDKVLGDFLKAKLVKQKRQA